MNKRLKSIVFVNPPIPNSARYGTSLLAGGQTPPIGLAYLAAQTRKHRRETAIIDACALGWSPEKVVHEIIGKKYAVVGITAVTVSISHAAKLAQKIKTSDSRIRIIIGGPHFTAAPEETFRRFPEFDLGIIGEGEETIVELMDAIEENSDQRKVRGIVFRDGPNLVKTPPRPLIQNLDQLPKPAWDLLPELKTFYCPPVHTLKKFPAGVIITSRGCPNRCLFCDRSVFGNKLRMHSVGYIFEMIRDLYTNYDLREIQFRDDNFSADKNFLHEICLLLKKEKMDLVWTCSGRVDTINLDLLREMKEAGCWQIWYGIESGSQRILNLIKKGTTLKQINRAIKSTHRSGIRPSGYFILGNPGETMDTLEETLRLALRLPLDGVNFTFTTPFPGSELYERASDFGIFENDWEKLNCWTQVFTPFGLTKTELRDFSARAHREFFFRFRIILGYLRKIRGWKHIQVYFNGFLALLQLLRKR